MIPINLLSLSNVPILEQLQLEEALLRADEENWCIINVGTRPAIVMGISGKPEELLDLSLTKRDNIPIIKRFSGGGTVFVDEETLFVTFIMKEQEPTSPRAIMQWSEALYAPFFPREFALRENDYVLGERKCGGNAQYIRRGRWLHHTSFLWDYSPKKMEYLLLPKKRPAYRGDRDHESFLCRLNEHFPSKDHFLDKFEANLKNKFVITGKSFSEIESILTRPHRKSTEPFFIKP